MEINIISNIKHLIKYWKDLSDYDIKTAKFMFQTKRYPYCLFMCHLSIEKLLKSLIVKNTKNHAPYSHNLVDLAKRSSINFLEEDKLLLADLTEFNLEARYPEWQKEFYLRCTKKYTEKYFNKTKKLQKWLKKYF
ncbi:MAG: HEPN domain-containing protein [Candidatus Kuenenbacteria bacterium]